MTVHNSNPHSHESIRRVASAVGLVVSLLAWIAFVAFVWVTPTPAFAFLSILVAVFGVSLFVKNAKCDKQH